MKNSLVLRDSAVIQIKHLDQLSVKQEYFCTFYSNICTFHDLAEMHLLKETAPKIQTEVERGKHVVTRSTKSRFNSVWLDLGLEQSVVKDTKSRQGGIIGFSRIQEATLKLYLTVHERSGILRNFKAICGLSEDEDQGHRDQN